MLYSFAECRRKYGSPYQIEKAIEGRSLFKMGVGVYSDTGKENELQIVQWRHPRAVLTFESAYFYYDLTDEIPYDLERLLIETAKGIYDTVGGGFLTGSRNFAEGR